jgi:hypothetical protein
MFNATCFIDNHKIAYLLTNSKLAADCEKNVWDKSEVNPEKANI